MPTRPLLFLYKSGRRGSPAAPTGPDEFFYGASAIVRSGIDVATLDSDEIAALADVRAAAAPAGLAWRMARAPLAAILPGYPSVIASHLFHPAVRARLAAAGTIVATTTGHAYALASLKAAGYLRARVVALAMGIYSDAQPRRQRALFGRLLRHIELVALSPAEADFLRARLPGHAWIRDIPFGVDARFWTPGVAPADGEPYVFAIGNDNHRDWATLIAAWSPDLPKLRIVTGMKLPPTPANVEALGGNWHKGGLSDEAVRDLYRGAALVVLPIKPTIQPSGQSACLQAMACGAPVAISDYEGLWDRERLRDGHACFLFKTGDPGALAARVRAALADGPARVRVARAARAAVESRFNSDAMGAALLATLGAPAVTDRAA